MSENGMDDEMSMVEEVAKDDVTEEQSTAEKQEIPYEIKDGFGLSVEEVKALVAKYNKIIIDDDEPTLFFVTIMNAYLQEVDKLNSKYSSVLKEIYSKQTKEYLELLDTATKQISKDVQSVSIEAINKANSENAQRLSAHRRDLWWASAIMAVSAIINVCVFILSGKLS